MLATLLAGATLAAGHVWEIERVDNGKWFWGLTDRSMRLDSIGHLHVAYGGDWLYYAHHDGSSWQTETVDSEHYVGYDAALALDGNAFPHISYHNQDDGDLKYACKDCTGWHLETVDSVGIVGASTSITVDDAGLPHITY
jgi:hypothetical protein